MTAMRKPSGLTLVTLFAVIACQSAHVSAQGRSSVGTSSSETTQNAVFLSYAKFKIPFNVQASASSIQAVQLWVSTDDGVTWQMHGAARPTDKDFSFQAAAEGRYLFSVQTVNTNGELFANPNPPLEVLVDTTKPEVAIEADSNELGQLVVEVRALDEHIDLASAELRLRTDRESAWQVIDMPEFEPIDEFVYRALATVDIGTCHEVAILFTVEDKAQNSGEATFVFGMPRTASGNTGMTLASTGNQKDFGSETSTKNSSTSPRLSGWDAWQAVEPTHSQTRLPGMAAPVELQRPGRLVTSGGGLELEPSSGAEEPNLKRQLAEELPAPPKVGAARGIPSADNLETQSHAETENSVGSAYQCKSRAFALDYAIEALGGGALSEVELWGTEDGGRTWQQWGSDPDRQSPFDVQVGNDGLFGFRMVIVGSNGLVSNRPKDGDQADMWINVDTTAPTAKITRAVYGEGDDDGMLVIDYTCQDSHLVDRPITLSYSKSLDGEWETIATGQKNSGLYIWKPSPNLPNQIYLRLEVADKAGNIGTHRLELPIDTKGLGPLGRIQGFRPILEPAK